MKLVISHDIDHLFWPEHWLHDLYIPKLWVKTLRFALRGQLPPGLALRRMIAPLTRRANNNLDELSELDRRQGIPSAFFVAVRRGLGLSYSQSNAAKAVALLRQRGHPVYLHGMAYDRPEDMQAEKRDFERLFGTADAPGIRNHYLRQTPDTLRYMQMAGYAFDSTQYRLASPHRVGTLVEVPVCLMDSPYLLGDAGNDQDDVRNITLAELEKAERAGVRHFTIDTHDVYFSDLYPDHKAWYRWLVETVAPRYEVTGFAEACAEAA